jgi:hypothetical protein
VSNRKEKEEEEVLSQDLMTTSGRYLMFIQGRYQKKRLFVKSEISKESEDNKDVSPLIVGGNKKIGGENEMKMRDVKLRYISQETLHKTTS